MKFYKTKDDTEVYAYESDGSQDAWIKPDLVPISDNEAAALSEKIDKANLGINETELRRSQIMAELNRIDAASSRPARAVAYAIANGNQADAADVAQLGALEAQAQSLRAELKALA